MSIRATLDISRPAGMGRFVHQHVSPGKYTSASETVGAALRRLGECEGRLVPDAIIERRRDARAEIGTRGIRRSLHEREG